MAFVHRRTFYGKVGTAGQLVQHLQEGDKALEKYGPDFKRRVLTDYRNGRTDRVMWEYEVENIGDIDAYYERVMADLQGQAMMQDWFKKLSELIHYAEVETWELH